MNVEHNKEFVSFLAMNELTYLAGWGSNYYKSEKVWKKVITSSLHIAYIKENNNLIAFGRVVDDGLMCMFYDICVHPNYQRKGLGTQIMKSLLSLIKDTDYVTKGLFVWSGNPKAKDFYKSIGFRDALAMEI